MESDRIRSTDSPEIVESKLQEKYGYSIFDFSFFLAEVFISGFYPHKAFNLRPRELKQIEDKLIRFSTEIAKYEFLKDLKDHADLKREMIALKIAEIKEHEGYKRRGIFLDIKTKIILSWGQLLRIPIRENRYIVDWDQYFRLLNWYLNILKTCPFIANVDLGGQESETRNAKLRYEKSRIRYSRSNSFSFVQYFQRQEYFKNKGKTLLQKINFEPYSLNTEGYPIIMINFNNDGIEIGELRKNGIILETRRFTEGKISVAERTIPSPALKAPVLSFPNGSSLILENYGKKQITCPPFNSVQA